MNQNKRFPLPFFLNLILPNNVPIQQALRHYPVHRQLVTGTRDKCDEEGTLTRELRVNEKPYIICLSFEDMKCNLGTKVTSSLIPPDIRLYTDYYTELRGSYVLHSVKMIVYNIRHA